MKIKTPLFDIKIDILFLIVMFIFLLYSKLRMFFSSFFVCYLFIVFHEASHMFVASIFGKSVETFNISLFGVSVTFKKEHYSISNKKIDKTIYIKDILVYMAGPISNLILAIIFKNIKIVFDINLFLCILNIIPIYPLDGYNILKNMLLFKYDGKKVERIINVFNYIFFIILFILGVISIIILYNPSLILFLIYILIIKNSYIKSKNKLKYYK